MLLNRSLFVVILSWQLHLSTLQFTLRFERTVDVITLSCHDDSLASNIDVERNESIRFYVNRTVGVRDGPADLEDREVNLERAGSGATFLINRAIEGYYSCGTENPQVGGEAQLLICEFLCIYRRSCNST